MTFEQELAATAAVYGVLKDFPKDAQDRVVRSVQDALSRCNKTSRVLRLGSREAMQSVVDEGPEAA